jgi:hypothetical protein
MGQFVADVPNELSHITPQKLKKKKTIKKFMRTRVWKPLNHSFVHSFTLEHDRNTMRNSIPTLHGERLRLTLKYLERNVKFQLHDRVSRVNSICFYIPQIYFRDNQETNLLRIGVVYRFTDG